MNCDLAQLPAGDVLGVIRKIHDSVWLTASLTQPQPDIDRFLHRMLFWMRWAAIVVLLLITLMQPVDSQLDVPTWNLMLLFSGYNLLVSVIQVRVPPLYTLARLAVLDLVVAALLYGLGGEAGGPLFVLFFLAVDTAAASMTLRNLVMYVVAVAVLHAMITVTFPQWTWADSEIRMLAAELVILGLVATGMAIVMRRLLYEHQRALLMRDEAERLELLDDLRSEFLATVSHELRTPLTAVRSALRLVEMSATDRLHVDERALLDNGWRNIERLSQLIDDLLVFNQLEAGILRLEREIADLRDVVRDALAAIEPLTQRKQQSVDIALPYPLVVEGDRRRLEQVITNLLVNAHVHTPPGTHISVHGSSTNGDIQLSVRDNGPGISDTEQQAIFERFYRISRASGLEGGSGLGLAIAKAIIELHGGRIWVESALGSGATFHIRIPRVEEEMT